MEVVAVAGAQIVVIAVEAECPLAGCSQAVARAERSLANPALDERAVQVEEERLAVVEAEGQHDAEVARRLASQPSSLEFGEAANVRGMGVRDPNGHRC